MVCSIELSATWPVLTRLEARLASLSSTLDGAIRLNGMAATTSGQLRLSLR
jgi:hypothetical protein